MSPPTHPPMPDPIREASRTNLGNSAWIARQGAACGRAALHLTGSDHVTAPLRDAVACLDAAHRLLTDDPAPADPAETDDVVDPVATAIHHTRTAAILAHHLATTGEERTRPINRRYLHAILLAAQAADHLDAVLTTLTAPTQSHGNSRRRASRDHPDSGPCKRRELTPSGSPEIQRAARAPQNAADQAGAR